MCYALLESLRMWMCVMITECNVSPRYCAGMLCTWEIDTA